MKEVKKKLLSHQSLVILAAIFGHAFFGVSYLSTRTAQNYASPETVLSHRFLFALLFMNILLMSGKGKLQLRGKNIKPMLWLCITELLVFFLESYAILYTNSTLVGVVLSTVPILSMVLGYLFLHEKPVKRQIFFCIPAIVGVIITTLNGSSLGIVTLLGALLLILDCLASAFYKTANRGASAEFTTFERTYIMLAAGFVLYTAIALWQHHSNLVGYFEPLSHAGYLLPIMTLVILCSVAANLLVNYAAANLPVFRLSIFGAFSTICSVLGGYFFLHEPITYVMLLGTVLIIVGIYGVNHNANPRQNQ